MCHYHSKVSIWIRLSSFGSGVMCRPLKQPRQHFSAKPQVAVNIVLFDWQANARP